MEEVGQPLDQQLSPERYVEELAGSDDYWMTITDADRVTRRQDVTLRRWITSGDLPVRKYRVGLNRRSRQVRASDVAKLTPIIDTSAMISGDEARISVTNIPAEHAAIRTDHQRLLAEVSGFQAQLTEQKQTTELAFVTHQTNWQQALDRAQGRVEQMFAQQQQIIEEHQQAAERMHADLLAQLAQQAKVAQDQQGELHELYERQLAQKELFQKALQAQQQAWELALKQQREEAESALEALKLSLGEVRETLVQRAETLNRKLDHQEQASFIVDKRRTNEIHMVQVYAQQEQQDRIRQAETLSRKIDASHARHEEAENQIEAQLNHLQEQESSLQQAQESLTQQLSTVASRLTAHQSDQVQARQQVEEQLTDLQVRFTLLEQILSTKLKEQAG